MTFKTEFDKFIKDEMAIANENYGSEAISNCVDVINFMAEYLEKHEPSAVVDIKKLKEVGILIDMHSLVYDEGIE
jgi:hypothetical protein